jgi:hypothetical protein
MGSLRIFSWITDNRTSRLLKGGSYRGNLQLVIRLLNRVRVSPMSEQFSYNTTAVERRCSYGAASIRASSRVLLQRLAYS